MRENGLVSTVAPKKHHIVIIGGGPGGYEAALAGIQLGAEVTLIERNGVGGSAVLTDVVPSKGLIAAAEAATSVAQAAELGIHFSIGENLIDLGEINKRLKAMAREQSQELTQNLLDQGVRIIHGSGRLDGNHHVIATSHDGKEERLEAKTIITRVGEGTKIVLTGDIEQIDNMYVDSVSNGLTIAIEKFKSYSISGHVTLTKGERSTLATLAAQIL